MEFMVAIRWFSFYPIQTIISLAGKNYVESLFFLSSFIFDGYFRSIFEIFSNRFFFQFVNRIPKGNSICRKDNLVRHLKCMKKGHGSIYDFRYSMHDNFFPIPPRTITKNIMHLPSVLQDIICLRNIRNSRKIVVVTRRTIECGFASLLAKAKEEEYFFSA